MSVHQGYSQESCHSIDSSDVGGEDSLEETVSMESIRSMKKRKSDGEDMVIDNLGEEKELVRYCRQKQEDGRLEEFQHGFVGFMNMGKREQVHINSSKMKKVKELFKEFQQSPSKHDDQNDISICDKSCSTIKITSQQINEIGGWKQREKQWQKQDNLYSDISLDFRSMGTGKIINISKDVRKKVKEFFEEVSKSVQKSTKSKAIKIKQYNKDDNDRETNFIKTQKLKFINLRPQKISNKIQKKHDLSQQKAFIQNFIPNAQTKYLKIKLCDMVQVKHDDAIKFAQYWSSYKYKDVQHTNKICSVKWCYFCQKYGSQSLLITKQFIQNQLLSIHQFPQQTKSRIAPLLQLTILKLSRITYFDNSIKNKQLCPNNILLQIYKKCIIYQKQKLAPLQHSIQLIINSHGKKLGRHINIMVVSVSYNQQIDVYFIQITDGWTCVFSIMSSNNYLRQFINKKIYIGSKLQIINWTLYPICNIISYHPNKQIAITRIPCIQVNYNNSFPSAYFSKLGWPHQTFYRMVSQCREGYGGCIPVVEGIVVRMFNSRGNKNGVVNYLEIMLRQGMCILMKICLAEQVSLIQLFRLYYCYQFLRVKKISKFMLEFVGGSKYYEVQDKQRLQKVKQLLKNRLINMDISKYIIAIKENKRCYYDLIIGKKQIIYDNIVIRIQQNISGVVLLQQYLISWIQDGIVVCKGDRGNCLKRIPKIYDTFQYVVL